jgi:hypothetical protein
LRFAFSTFSSSSCCCSSAMCAFAAHCCLLPPDGFAFLSFFLGEHLGLAFAACGGSFAQLQHNHDVPSAYHRV